MSYTRVNWNSTTTYVSAENLNVMDKGIKDLDTNIGDVTTLTTTAKTVVPAIKELKTGLEVLNNNLYIKQLVNKKIAFLGDSICFGYGWRPSSTDTTTPTGWGKVIQDNNASATVSNKGVSGARICKNTTNDSLVDQVESLVSNKLSISYDYIILEGGINDQFAQSSLGSYTESYSITYDESIVSTVYGALDYIFYKLQIEFEDSRIGYIISNRDASYTSKSGYRKYIDAIVKMCQKWSVPILNLWDCGELNPVLVNIKNKYVPDGTHPNELCYKKLLAPKIASWIKSDLITNPILTMNDIFRSWEWCSDCNNEFHFGYKTITPESANCPMSGYGLLIVETAGDSESWIYHTIKYNTGQIYRRVKVNQGDFSTWA